MLDGPNMENIKKFLGSKNYTIILNAGITNAQLLQMYNGSDLDSFSKAVDKTYKHIMRQKDAEQSQQNKDARETIIALMLLPLLAYASVEFLKAIHAGIVTTATAFVEAGNSFDDFVSKIDLSSILQLANKSEGSSAELAILLTEALAGFTDVLAFGGIPATTIACKVAVALATGYAVGNAAHYLVTNWDNLSSQIPGAQTFGEQFIKEVKNYIGKDKTSTDTASQFAKFVAKKLQQYIESENIDPSANFGWLQIKAAKSEEGELDIRKLVKEFCTKNQVDQGNFLKEMAAKYNLNLKDLEKKFSPSPVTNSTDWFNPFSCCGVRSK